MLNFVCYTRRVTKLETRYSTFSPLVLLFLCALCVVLLSYDYFCNLVFIVLLCVCVCVCVCIAVLHTLVAGQLARSQYPEGPATGHLNTGFSWFPCIYKQILRWFPRFQVATTCFLCILPDLNLLVTNFIFMYVHNNHCHLATANLQLNIIIII